MYRILLMSWESASQKTTVPATIRDGIFWSVGGGCPQDIETQIRMVQILTNNSKDDTNIPHAGLYEF